ncbi:MAG: mycothione reductase [Pseudonocardiales bacterium]|jgi:mycothione reductase|nr:mycothione reductase [Pseudonocardiales bacterium]
MRHHDLVVIGTGSGNNIVDEAFADLDVAIVEHGPFGGTCLNVGCIPSKMLSYPADLAESISRAAAYGIDASIDKVRWSDIRDRVFGRLDPIAEDGRDHRINSCPSVEVYLGHARFTGPLRLRVERTDGTGYDDLSADRMVLAAGARPMVPEPVATAGVPFETSDSIMRRPELPRRLAILGGGYVAVEFAHLFAALGSAVTVIDMADQLLGTQDETVATRFTELARRRYGVRLGGQISEVTGEEGDILITLDDGAALEADTLLVAVGRVPNSDRLNVRAAGIDVHPDGRVAVDSQQRTSVPGIYALGDLSTAVQLKHVANREARVVAHNLLHPDDPIETDNSLVPAAVFTNPQIASVGRTEQDCRDEELDYTVSTQPYSDTAYGWALEDTTGFCKIIAERGSGRLLGAHLMGPQAPTLIQPLVIAMTFDIDARALARRPYWIHPALPEVVENALLKLTV